MAFDPPNATDDRGGRDVRAGSRAVVLIAAAVIIAGLYAARQILMPFALAVLFGFLLSPLMTRLQRWHVRRTPAALISVALGLSAFLGVGWLVTSQAGGLASELVGYRQKVVERVRRLRTSFGGRFGEAREAIQEIRNEINGPATTAPASESASSTPASTPMAMPPGAGVQRPAPREVTEPWPWERNPFRPEVSPEESAQPVAVRIQSDGNALHVLAAVLGPLVWPLVNVGMATVLVIFMLLQREELLDRVIRLVGRGHLPVTTEALATAASGVSRFLAVQAFVNALHGTAIGVGLAFLGVPRAALWGLLAALLRYVPFLGTWVAAAVPTLLALAVFDDWGRPLLVAALFVVIDLVSANVLEPWLFGARTGVAPIAIVISAIFWTWLWGGMGLFLATPLTVCLVVLGRHVPHLEFLAVLLSDQPALPLKLRFYQRLLSLDDLGAAETAREARRAKPVLELYEALFMPALLEAEKDIERGVLDLRRQGFIWRTVGALIREHDDGRHARAKVRRFRRGPIAEPVAASDPTILCAGARGPSDELAVRMLGQVLTGEGFNVRIGSASMLAAELVEQVRRDAIAVVCVCAVADASRLHVRYLCKRLRRSVPQVRATALVWGDEADKAAEAAPGETCSEVATTLDDARQAAGGVIRRLRLASAEAKTAERRPKGPRAPEPAAPALGRTNPA